jgi:hypothetical protein
VEAAVLAMSIGTILVWLYVAARTRLGPGKTATLIALTVWLLGAIFFSDFPLTGMISGATYALLEALELLAFLVVAWAGRPVYVHQSRLFATLWDSISEVRGAVA